MDFVSYIPAIVLLILGVSLIGEGLQRGEN